MSKEEILRYIFSCVSFKHMFDLSPRITDSSQKKEDLLFSSAVFFLRELSKNKNVFVEDIKKESTMKEVTYEDWEKNPTPRKMYVWNNEEEEYVLRKVVCILSENDLFNRVIAIENDDSDYALYKHCAEIEEPKARRMTNKELARWLREKPTRECTHRNDSDDRLVYSIHTYLEICANEEVDDCILIREDDSDWREPLVEE